jgi:hypothetical protein
MKMCAMIVCLGLIVSIPAWNLAAQETSNPQAPPGVMEMIQQIGAFSFTDGSSIFTFHSDHLFTLTPSGMSGRSVTGFWSLDSDGMFLVTGQWQWQNGVSREDDYREMVISVTYMGGEADTSNPFAQTPLYPVYFTIERLSAISQATYQERLQSASLPATE